MIFMKILFLPKRHTAFRTLDCILRTVKKVSPHRKIKQIFFHVATCAHLRSKYHNTSRYHMRLDFNHARVRLINASPFAVVRLPSFEDPVRLMRPPSFSSVDPQRRNNYERIATRPTQHGLLFLGAASRAAEARLYLPFPDGCLPIPRILAASPLYRELASERSIRARGPSLMKPFEARTRRP